MFLQEKEVYDLRNRFTPYKVFEICVCSGYCEPQSEKCCNDCIESTKFHIEIFPIKSKKRNLWLLLQQLIEDVSLNHHFSDPRGKMHSIRFVFDIAGRECDDGKRAMYNFVLWLESFTLEPFITNKHLKRTAMQKITDMVEFIKLPFQRGLERALKSCEREDERIENLIRNRK